MSEYQGFVATLQRKGRKTTDYCKFGGGLTRKWDEAEVLPTREQAFALARLRGKSIWDVPGCIPIGDDAMPASEVIHASNL